MKLKDLLRGAPIVSVCADGEVEITGISCDSRTTRPGELFVAITGETEDGECFITEALAKGAACILCRHSLQKTIPHAVADSCRRALAVLSANWFDHPAKELTLVGVTGTNGKTTSTYLIKRILEEQYGAKVGLIGTICNWVGDRPLPTERTTPDPYRLHQLLRQMADGGCTHAVMEVSSHALAMDRVYGIRFAAALFTNLTQDHLDYHHTMEAYCDAKARLFASCDLAVYNKDDPWAQRLLQSSTCRRYSYGFAAAELTAKDVLLTSDGVRFTAQTEQEAQAVRVPIPGRFTVYNALAAMAVCHNLGVPLSACAQTLRFHRGAKGRMEVVPTPNKPYTVLIDYAHTPDALENVLRAVKGFAKGRTVALFGCGGDRDRTKRPQMGEIAARLADFSVVTTDNPRTERPMDIIADILQGMDGAAYQVIENRTEAIRWALDHGEKDDVIVLCGKGHEDYQEVGHQKLHLDEREVVAEYLRDPLPQ